ncbi:MAG: SDR family oxidoreductase [Candidatus Omnitrophica bacterium]|nr:SDR family oxidoreductase [Candidatus Omnitrophota bacterium]
MSVYLVTGGAGFIGSHIATALLKKGHEVRIIDNLVTGKEDNISHIAEDIQFFKDDIRDEDALRRALKGVEYVIHQAALRSVPKSIDDPLSYNEVNVAGSLKLLLEARAAGVRRLVFASSSSVYGESPHLPQTETDLPLLISPYAATKLAGEYYNRVFSSVYGLETVSLRYFNVFGPRQDVESQYAVVIPKFILCILAGESPPVHGDGQQTRDFTYVDNVVEANLLACHATGASGEVFNIACGSSNSVLDIVTLTNDILGKDIRPVFTEARKGDVRHTQADIAKAYNVLQYNPTVNFQEGLRRTIAYFEQRFS